MKYLDKITENYKGIHHSGYSRITNDIRKCDRLTSIEYKMLEELINTANTKRSVNFKLEKWRLEKMLNVKERRV